MRTKSLRSDLLNQRFIILCILGYLLMFGYALVRPSIDSLFLEHNTAKQLPVVWIIVIFVALGVTTVLNRYTMRISLLKVFASSCYISIISLLIFQLVYKLNVHVGAYVLVIWKEVYIVVLVELFWCFANTLYSIRDARVAYGLLLAIGSLGSVTGNIIVGPLAKSIGTHTAIYSGLPMLFVCALIGIRFGKFYLPLRNASPNSHATATSMSAMLKSSAYLIPLALLVLVGQAVTTLVEFEYSTIFEHAYIDMDSRTAVMGQVNAAINICATILQLLTGQIFRFIGISGTLIGMPLVLTATITTFLISPQSATIIIAKVIGKSFDYSLLRASKEILYIPLSDNEKTQGKALIDIFMYRTARGLCSILLLALTYYRVGPLAIRFAFILIVAWLMLATVIAKRFRRIVSVEEEYAIHNSAQT